MQSKLFYIDNIGNIEICKHHNSKKLAIKIKPGSIPKVIIPKLMTFKMGYQFAMEKKQWILYHAKKIQEQKLKNNIDVDFNLKTRFHEIKLSPNKGQKTQAVKDGKNITIYYPETAEITSENIQQNIKAIIIEILRVEAKKHLIPRTQELAQKCGFKVNRIFVKNLKSRWGSCSAQNNINLNLHLMRLPEYLSDFIILHELCHTIHKNHGPHFHSLLNKLVGDEKKFNKELKNYATQL